MKNTRDIGILADCTFIGCSIGSKVTNNVVIGTYDEDECYKFVGDYWLIEENTASLCTRSGIQLKGSESFVHKNVITFSGAEFIANGDTKNVAGIDVSGNKNLISKNIVKYNNYAGINQKSGMENMYVENTIESNGMYGIVIQNGESTFVSANVFSENSAEGVAILAGTQTEVNENKMTDNKSDICDEGTDTIFTDNEFETGGAGVTCEVY